MAWPRWFVEGGAERNSATAAAAAETVVAARSEEHTSELQSRSDLVCRLLLEKKNILATAERPRSPRQPNSGAGIRVATPTGLRRGTHPRRAAGGRGYDDDAAHQRGAHSQVSLD